MKKVIIIGANELQNQVIIAANKMGLETHVFAWEKDAVGKNNASKFYPISITEKEKILRKCKKINPDGVLSVGSDLAMPTVNYLVEKLNLVGHSATTTKWTTNKYEMRKKLNAEGIPCPRYQKLDRIEDFDIDKFKFPLIVKPTDRSGSRGVKKVNNLDELQNAVEEAKRYSFKDEVLVEEFFSGVQYSIETITINGEHVILGVTEEFYTGDPYFVEKQHLFPGRISNKYREKIEQIILHSLNVLGIRNGASHSEIRVNSRGQVNIIEIAGRMGGDFRSDLVEISTGLNYINLCLNIAMNNSMEIEKISQSLIPKNVGLIKWIFNEEDYYNFLAIKNNYSKNLYRYNIKGKNFSRMIQNSSERIGYFILKGNSQEKLLKLVGDVNNND